jgi:hypothetical protein
MALRKLTRSEWRSFCDRVSRGAAGGACAELEVAALELGDHVAARWLPLFGLAYDTRSDVLEVVLQGVDHLIAQPCDLFVEETPRGLVGIEIVAADETRQVLKLREPLSLPPEGAVARRFLRTGDAK